MTEPTDVIVEVSAEAAEDVNRHARRFGDYRRTLERMLGAKGALLRIASDYRQCVGTEPYVVDAGFFDLIRRALEDKGEPERSVLEKYPDLCAAVQDLIDRKRAEENGDEVRG